MPAWPVTPGVPAAGHTSSSGFWHPGQIDGCVKCPQTGPRPGPFTFRWSGTDRRRRKVRQKNLRESGPAGE